MFHYCDFRSKESLKATEILRSMIRQLIEKRQNLPKCVEEFYTRCLGHDMSDLSSLQDLFVELIESQGAQDITYLAVDGIDESPSATELLDIFTSLSESSIASNLRIMIVSRPEYSITEALVHYPSVEISPDKVGTDIELHVSSAFRAHRRLCRLDKDTAKLMISTICTQAHGM